LRSETGNVHSHYIKNNMTNKFTSLEQLIIINSLRNSLEAEIVEILRITDEGKTSLFTVDYMKSIYNETMEKVTRLTVKAKK
jgi:hypothetical protein